VHLVAVEPIPITRHEDGRLSGQLSPLREVTYQRLARRLTKGNHSLLAPLSHDSQRPLIPGDIFEVDAAEFGDSKAGIQQHEDDGSQPGTGEPAATYPEQGLYLTCREGLNNFPRHADLLHAVHWVDSDGLLTGQKLEEGTECDEAMLRGDGRDPLSLGGHEVAYDRRRNRRRIGRDLRLLQVAGEGRQASAVEPECRGGQVPSAPAVEEVGNGALQAVTGRGIGREDGHSAWHIGPLSRMFRAPVAVGYAVPVRPTNRVTK